MDSKIVDVCPQEDVRSAVMALPGAGGPGVTAHPRNAVPGLEDDTTGPGMEVNQIGEAESLIRSRCLADTGTPRA